MKHREKKASRRRARPFIEHLEDRTLLSGISGRVFEDFGIDGRFDPGDRGLPGWTVEVDVGADGRVDLSTVTGSDGTYVLPDLPVAPIIVSARPPAGSMEDWRFVPVAPPPIVPGPGIIPGFDFAVYQLAPPPELPDQVTALFDSALSELTIIGTDLDDNVEVTLDGENHVQIALITDIRTPVPIYDLASGVELQYVAASQVHELSADTKDGDDTFVLNTDHDVVVAIIGILASVAIPKFLEYQERGKTTEAKVELLILGDELANHMDVALFSQRETSSVNADVNVVIQGRGGDDTIDVRVGDVQFSEGGSFHLRVDGGAGNDQITTGYAEKGGVSPEPFAPATIDIRGGGGDDRLAVIAEVVHSFMLTVDGGAGNDQITTGLAEKGGVSPEPFTPAAIDINLKGGGGDDTLSAVLLLPAVQRGLDTPPDPVHVHVLMDGGAGLDTMLSRVAFNPQPDPPSPATGFAVQLVVEMNGGGGDDTIESLLLLPAVLVGFNPQPDPPITITMAGEAGDDTVIARVAFNPQPDPPDPSLFQLAAITMDGGAGNDMLRGSQANEVMLGGRGDDVLVGGDGDDVLLGGAGQDVLIGGFGADVLMGEGGDDLLISGATAFDMDDAALRAISAEWSSGGNYATHIDNLTGQGRGRTFDTRLNGNVFLGISTVSDDGARDVLIGGAGRDWFFANAAGEGTRDVMDLGGKEQFVDV